MADENDRERAVRDSAARLADCEFALNEEYVRLTALGRSSYDAHRQAEIKCGRDVIMARAELEIALARLKEGCCHAHEPR